MVKEVLLAGGCFWGLEARFQAMPGVVETEVGYCGGTTENPTYQDVCKDVTGHVETVRVVFDDAILSYRDLLEAFFRFHDPTDSAFPCSDFGSQYRSVIFFEDEEERDTAEAVIAFLDVSGVYDQQVNTELHPACTFYPAEDYHQHYYQKHNLSIPDEAEE